MYISGSELIYNLDNHFYHGMGKRIHKFLFIKPCSGNHYIVPRELIFVNKNGKTWLYNHTPKEYLFFASVCNDNSDDESTECSNCEYAVNCNGQLCMFAMM